MPQQAATVGPTTETFQARIAKVQEAMKEFGLQAVIVESGPAMQYLTGVRWGRHLHTAEPDAGVVELLDRQGFAAEGRDDRIEMRRCPFYALAESSPQVVCTLHQGLIDGVLEAGGAEVSVERLDPLVEPGLCVAHLARRA